ncbi:hypothetical protein ACVIGB_000883 [Bradyrhizobium sp. USDA 4341]
MRTAAIALVKPANDSAFYFSVDFSKDSSIFIVPLAGSPHILVA